MKRQLNSMRIYLKILAKMIQLRMLFLVQMQEMVEIQKVAMVVM